MKRKALAMLLCTAMAVSMAVGCGSSDSKSEDTAAPAETEEAADKDDAAEETGAAEAVDTAAATLDAIDAASLPEGKWKIGFSNYSVGNSWRQQMEAEFESEAEKLKEAGIISDYVMLNADNDQSKQISDINDLITMGCDAIVVTAITRMV